MSTTNGVNVAMLLDEQPEFWEFLATTGDIWTCTVIGSVLYIASSGPAIRLAGMSWLTAPPTTVFT